MRVWGKGSQVQRATIVAPLREVLDKVLALRDLTIIEGHRGEEAQNAAYEAGNSKLKWPDGKHNKFPSEAVDIQPYPYHPESLREDLSYLAGLIVATGVETGYDIRWGGDWDQDGETADNNFDDMFHFEYKGKLT